MQLRLLFYSLRHRRWRHLLNAIAMATTVAIVIVFVSVVVELVAYVRKSSDRDLTRVLIFPTMVGSELPMALHPILKEIEGVQVVERYRVLRGRHPSGATYIIVGEEDSGIELNTDFFPVEPQVIEAWKNERPMGAIVTEATAADLGLEVGKLAEVPTPRGPLRFKVVGISYGAKIGQRIAVHFEYLQEFAGNPGTCRLRVFTKPDDYQRVAREVHERTKNSAMPAQAVNEADVAAGWVRRAGMVPAVLGFLGVFLIFVTAMTLASTSAIAVRERRTEIATMRVLGYYRRTIANVLLAEAVLIGLIGGAIGIVLTTVVIGNGLQLTPGESQLLPPITIGRAGMISGVVTAILIPLLGALPSTWATMRMPLAEALRDTA